LEYQKNIKQDKKKREKRLNLIRPCPMPPVAAAAPSRPRRVWFRKPLATATPPATRHLHGARKTPP